MFSFKLKEKRYIFHQNKILSKWNENYFRRDQTVKSSLPLKTNYTFIGKLPQSDHKDKKCNVGSEVVITQNWCEFTLLVYKI